jgi:hypothetical protein
MISMLSAEIVQINIPSGCCFAWSLWLISNELVFQNLVVPSPNVSVFCAIHFLQKWRILNNETDQQWIDTVIQKLNLQLSSLRHED